MSPTDTTTQTGEIAISVRGVSKKYHITPGPETPPGVTEFTALNNVSFDLLKGEVIGIVGSNGSGKTTLLKILSSITKPTAGEVHIHGHATSILDIGSNFHPDLSGRENTRMHLRLNNIKKELHTGMMEKVRSFSGIGEFFDQPVKYYSNGMFLRLAFSVVFNLAADILILDEVLSVGDENFRMKSHNLINELRRDGRSILFVSHGRNEVMELCTKCIWLDKGSIRQIGIPNEVLGAYFEEQKKQYDDETAKEKKGKGQTVDQGCDGIDLSWDGKNAPGNEVLAIRAVHIRKVNGDVENLYTDEPALVTIVIDKLDRDASLAMLVMVHDNFNEPIMLAYSLNNVENIDYTKLGKGETGLFEYTCEIPPRLLSAGTYYLSARFGKNPGKESQFYESDFHMEDILRFRLKDKPEQHDFIGTSLNVNVRPALKWSCAKKAGQ